MCRAVIIQASSRANGNTQIIVDHLASNRSFDVIKLLDFNIGHYDYEFGNKKDDFRKLFKKIANNYSIIIFATPIYWYTMSGQLKVFLDRISDFLSEEQEYGRKLKGKQMAVVSCGSEAELFNGFLMPFEKTAEYLGMSFVGHLHCWLETGKISDAMKGKIEDFSNKIIPIENIQ